VATPERIVIAGGGVAAQRCAFKLRELGFDGTLTMVCGEASAPYDRTLLSKDLLAVEPPSIELTLEPAPAYGEAGIELRLDTRATGLDPHARRLRLEGGDETPFDKLVICTGGTAQRPRALVAPGTLVLRELADVAALRDALDACERLIVIGGGFIGGEVASSAAARGLAVTMIEALPAPLAGALGPEVGARVASLHESEGIEVLAGTAAHGCAESANGYEVTLEDGRVIRGDAVVLGAGMAPATEWLAGSGVELDDGIVTDAGCQTSAPDVLAAGDCARWWNPRYATHMRVEHWDTAGRHGATAAAAALGEEVVFAPIPFFWSDQHGVKLQYVGYAPTWDDVQIDDLDPPRSFVARYQRDGELKAVFAASQPRAIAAARRELAATERTI